MTILKPARQAAMERIEDEMDSKAYEAALQAYREDPATYSQEEVEKELGSVKSDI